MNQDLTDILTNVLSISTLIALIISIFLITLFSLKISPKLSFINEKFIYKKISNVALPCAWIVASISMVTSLYYSEIAGFTTCNFCWYERIAMYPLVIILGIASWKEDIKIKLYALPIAIIGMLISLYHYQLQLFPSQTSISCDKSASCSGSWFLEYGFISIPFMAFTAFLLIISFLLLTDRIKKI